VSLGYAKQGIRVYAVCPWMTDTPMANRLASNQVDAKADFAKLNPSGRFVKPEEIVEVVLAMFDNSSRFISGDVVLVDSGGQTQKVQMPHAL
jgi:NAD(P)-dependent dehydrogenase (short-subunit alcohol dehydrogenase family)